MNIRSAKGYSNFSFSLLLTFLICVIIAVGVALFHSQYFASKILEYKSSEISNKLNSSRSLSLAAKDLLHSRDDIGYLKIVNEGGEVQKSFDNDEVPGTEEIVLKLHNGSSVVVGLRSDVVPFIDPYALSWSLIIGIILAVVLIFIVSVRDSNAAKLFKELGEAMKRVTQGDYTVRLGVDSFLDQGGKKDYVESTYESFNKMVRSLDVRFRDQGLSPVHSSIDTSPGPEEEDVNPESDHDTDIEEYDMDEDIVFSDDSLEPEDEPEDTGEADEEAELLLDEEGEDEGSEMKTEPEALDAGSDQDEESYEMEDEDQEEIEESAAEQKLREEPLSSEQEESVRRSLFVSSVDPRVQGTQGTLRSDLKSVSVMVIRIEDLEDLSRAEYVRRLSEIISSYGGKEDPSPQGELVAVFNDSGEHTHPGMRPTCAAVEILKELADAAARRRSENRGTLTGRVGISTKDLPCDPESDFSVLLGELTEDAKNICEVTKDWKLSVSCELYEEIKDFVEAGKYLAGGRTVYSVRGVEHGVVHPEGGSSASG